MTSLENKGGADERRRDFPRLVVACPLEIVPTDREGIRAIAYNISRGGIQVRCDFDAARELVAFMPGESEHQADKMEARLVLWFDGQRLELDAVCRRCYVTKTPDARVAMGFEFVELTTASRQALVRFIESMLEPA